MGCDSVLCLPCRLGSPCSCSCCRGCSGCTTAPGSCPARRRLWRAASECSPTWVRSGAEHSCLLGRAQPGFAAAVSPCHGDSAVCVLQVPPGDNSQSRLTLVVQWVLSLSPEALSLSHLKTPCSAVDLQQGEVFMESFGGWKSPPSPASPSCAQFPPCPQPFLGHLPG